MNPAIEQAIRAELADAWDAGYDAGDPYHRRGNPDDAKRSNPYRTTPTNTPTEGDERTAG